MIACNNTSSYGSVVFVNTLPKANNLPGKMPRANRGCICCSNNSRNTFIEFFFLANKRRSSPQIIRMIIGVCGWNKELEYLWEFVYRFKIFVEWFESNTNLGRSGVVIVSYLANKLDIGIKSIQRYLIAINNVMVKIKLVYDQTIYIG